MRSFRQFLFDPRGATAIEYTFLAAMIALVVVAVLPLIGVSLKDRFQMVVNALN